MNMVEWNKWNNNLLIIVIVILALVISVMWFFLGKMSAGNNGTPIVANYDDLTVTVITDSRDTLTPVDDLVSELEKLPSISNAKVVKKDFWDNGVEELLKEAWIEALPAVLFSTNNFDVSADPIQFWSDWSASPKLNAFLQPLSNGLYFLEIGATYDPFMVRSDRGFSTISQEEFDAVVWNSYLEWSNDSKFVWVEYSDLECPYCAKFHNEDTTETVVGEYEWQIQLAFNHFPLSFHSNAQTAAETLECLAEQKGSVAFYSLMRTSFANADFSGGWIDASDSSSKSFLVSEAVKLWANEEELLNCISESRYSDKISEGSSRGTEMFGITGTPGNVIINRDTLEYEVVSGAYPASTFREVLERLK